MGLRKCKGLKFGGLGQGVPMIVLTYVLTMEPGGPLPLSDCVLPAIYCRNIASLTPSAGDFDRNRASDDRSPPSLIGRNYPVSRMSGKHNQASDQSHNRETE